MANQFVEILDSPRLTPLISLCLVCLVLLYRDGGGSGSRQIVYVSSNNTDGTTKYDKLLTVASGSPSASNATNTCELPPCELVLQSRLASERCGTAQPKWPLLITGTPRSATVYALSLIHI